MSVTWSHEVHEVVPDPVGIPPCPRPMLRMDGNTLPPEDQTLPCLLNSAIFWGTAAGLLGVWAIIVRLVIT